MLRRGKVRRRWLGVLMLVLTMPMAMADEVVGTLGAVGSDTLAGLMLRWGEQLTDRHPGVRLQLQASGSASAPPALMAGTTRLGPMSRAMSDAERGDFVEHHGYPPVAIEVARDALVVVVHRHNPLEGLRLTEVDAIFSDTRRCGGEQAITRWRELGIERPDGPLALHGRNAASGTYGLFRQRALCNGDFRVRLDEHPGSAAVVAAVAASPRAIGYAGRNHLTAGVRALTLVDAEGNAYRPDPERVRQGDYPLSRTLYLYLNLPPGQALPGPERAFVELILSPEGQETVTELGFVALPQATLERQRRRLGLNDAP
ncbi:PstS family phosphate ABC transporter substrate-binding protein [Halomonas heilongjiangensis]|uniref:Phosphate ABC transporter substrate-binding protein n=1 Tax=Halomonas heilongjiangensis TaxID=1387883 RepID=A0A2N7TSN6_9GAMM|nr:phosphate ABC transporter substrate-binding protein [Halomonas heilongjiangensis]PMR71185.1 phosphate ABC transporter substrate-binding protein [Halomonas heilongjiangensis]PXX92965.1 phosphate ABC transporter substrate-binding protein [Halomonas heilongjiangensis]